MFAVSPATSVERALDGWMLLGRFLFWAFVVPAEVALVSIGAGWLAGLIAALLCHAHRLFFPERVQDSSIGGAISYKQYVWRFPSLLWVLFWGFVLHLIFQMKFPENIISLTFPLGISFFMYLFAPSVLNLFFISQKNSTSILIYCGTSIDAPSYPEPRNKILILPNENSGLAMTPSEFSIAFFGLRFYKSLVPGFGAKEVYPLDNEARAFIRQGMRPFESDAEREQFIRQVKEFFSLKGLLHPKVPAYLDEIVVWAAENGEAALEREGRKLIEAFEEMGRMMKEVAERSRANAEAQAASESKALGALPHRMDSTDDGPLSRRERASAEVRVHEPMQNSRWM